MEFDASKVYTVVNADELHRGDFVFVSDTLQELKTLVEFNDKADLKEIHLIRAEDKHNRFYVGDDDYGGKYILAYLVCPVRNAEAYKAWREGKLIEHQIIKGGHWLDVNTREEISSDAWLFHTFRVKAPKSQYRPYKDVDELITSYKHSHCYKDNDDIMPLIWVQKKSNKYLDKHLITGFVSAEDGEFVMIGNALNSLGVLFEQYTFLDGTPCGVEEV